MASTTHADWTLGSPAFQRMQRDWADLGDDLAAEDRVAAWAELHPELLGVSTPHGLADLFLALHRSEAWAQYDRAFGVLIRLVRGGGSDGELAWRIAAHILLPQMRKLAWRLKRNQFSYDEVLSTLLSSLFEVIGTYPLERRPAKVFTNIWMDTKKLAFRHLDAEYETQGELQRVRMPLHESESDDPAVVAAEDSYIQKVLTDLLIRATALELVGRDEPHLVHGDARADLVTLIVYAIDIGALTPREAKRVAEYYLRPASETGRFLAGDARTRQRASRATRPLRDPELIARYLASRDVNHLGLAV
ncbi:MAG: hypothetical protein HOV68_05260 [Streptomycetaceae bacterium]|nr:hypothetical protein [Streptomycetaceae bacterium]